MSKTKHLINMKTTNKITDKILVKAYTDCYNVDCNLAVIHMNDEFRKLIKNIKSNSDINRNISLFVRYMRKGNDDNTVHFYNVDDKFIEEHLYDIDWSFVELTDEEESKFKKIERMQSYIYCRLCIEGNEFYYLMTDTFTRDEFWTEYINLNDMLMRNLNLGDYHKIDSLYKRDKKGKIIINDYSKKEFEFLKDIIWIATEKVDGTNIHFDLITDSDSNVTNITINGRTDKAEIPDYLLNQLESVKDKLIKTKVFKPNSKIQIFGEGYGNKIQDGSCYSDTQKFIVFDIVIIGENKKWYLDRDTVQRITEEIGLDIVPVIFIDTLSEIENYVKYGIGSMVAENDNVMAEGVVCVPSVPLFDNKGERIIVKIKTKDYK